MKKIILLLSIAFLLLQSCSSNDSSSDTNPDSTSKDNVDYSYTITFDGKTYKVKGNTANDYGGKGPVNNECTARSARVISLTITDPSYTNYLSGSPMYLRLATSSNFITGLNSLLIDTNIPKLQNLNYQYVNITDLGTASTGEINTPNYKYGKTIKGNFKQTIYTGSNYTNPKELEIVFEAVRLY